MNRMRIHGQLCDVKLKSGMVSIPAHKVVLASISPYFHAMFNGNITETALLNEIPSHPDNLSLPYGRLETQQPNG